MTITFDDAVRLGDEYRRAHSGAPDRREHEYDPIGAFHNRIIQCGHCSLSGHLHVEFDLERPDLYGIDDPGVRRLSDIREQGRRDKHSRQERTHR